MLSACGSQDEPDAPAAPPWPDYSGYTDLDNEPNNNSQDKAVSIISGGVTNLIQGINFKGSLVNFFAEDENGRTILVLDEDYYKVDLKYKDIISITISNATNIPSPFNVRFYGPCLPPTQSDCADKKIDILNLTGSLQDTIKTGHVGTGQLIAPATFWIKISNVVSISQSNLIYKSTPYAITFKLLSRD